MTIIHKCKASKTYLNGNKAIRKYPDGTVKELDLTTPIEPEKRFTVVVSFGH